MKDIYEKIQAELALHQAELIAVSKKQPAYKIKEARQLGITNFGENYIQEALEKINQGAFEGSILHFIGHLQTNKAKEAVKHFDYIHSVDRIKLINAIEKEASKLDKVQKIFIHVKTHKDDSKSGCVIDEVDCLVSHIKENCNHIDLQGFMCIPPKDINPEEAFQAIDKLKKQYKLKHASMGMSSDYKLALKHGATFIRVGTALFGKRS